MVDHGGKLGSSLENLLPWLVLALLLFYTFVEIVYAPYIGFLYSPSTGRIQRIFVEQPLNSEGEPHIQTGDTLVAVGTLSLSDWQKNLGRPLFQGVKAGDKISLKISHDGTPKSVAEIIWKIPGWNRGEFRSRMVNMWWLGYIFWVAGAATVLMVRPRDSRSRTLAAFFLLTSTWLVVGNTSRWGHFGSQLLFRSVVWLTVPVGLHFHWNFPKPLRPLPPLLLWIGYATFGVLALLQGFQFLPGNLFSIAFSLSLAAYLLLLLAHVWLRPGERNQVWLLCATFALSVLPPAAYSIIWALGASRGIGPLILLSFPALTVGYFYSLYRYQLGGMELRANRLIALYLFLLLLMTGIIALASMLRVVPAVAEDETLAGILCGIMAALVAILVFPTFQRFVERRILSMPLPPVHLPEQYVERITTSLSQDDLVQLLKGEILPSLLVRQSALLVFKQGQFVPVYTHGVDMAQLPTGAELPAMLDKAGFYRASPAECPPLPNLTWIQVALPLRFDNKLRGAWLLGRRDPDDFYTQGDIETLRTLAHQTSLALVNIEQAERLMALYQANIDRHEMERKELAMTLHDEILNRAALLYVSLNKSALTPVVESAYDSLKNQTRHLIAMLRPPMLDYGLHAALRDLADSLADRAGSQIQILFAVPESPVRFLPKVEEYLFRIVQQACENTLRHAHAKMLNIYGSLTEQGVMICVEDDGVGFVTGEELDMARLLTGRHFGLVGMYERAGIIGAELVINSAPGAGTRIQVSWTDKQPTTQEKPVAAIAQTMVSPASFSNSVISSE